MAWTKKTVNDMLLASEVSISLPTGSTRGYSSEIDFLKLPLNGNNRYVTFVLTPSAVSGTNLDIELYAAWESGGTKVLLKDAPVADLTADATAVAGVVDLAAYPAPYYYLAWLTDADEQANTIDVRVMAKGL